MSKFTIVHKNHPWYADAYLFKYEDDTFYIELVTVGLILPGLTKFSTYIDSVREHGFIVTNPSLN